MAGRSVADGNRQGLGTSAVEAAGLRPAPGTCPGYGTLNLSWEAFRGSEPVAVSWADAHEVERGVEWRVRSSKSDQFGHGECVGAACNPNPLLCSAASLLQWRHTLSDAGATRKQVRHHGRWTNVSSIDPNYRKTQVWGTNNPSSRLAAGESSWLGATRGPVGAHSDLRSRLS